MVSLPCLRAGSAPASIGRLTVLKTHKNIAGLSACVNPRHLQEAATLLPSAPGTFQLCGWADVVELQPATPDAGAGAPANVSKRRRLAKQVAGAAARPGSTRGPAVQGWLPQAEHVVQRFDQQLSKALAAALDACGSSAQAASTPPAVDANAAGAGAAPAARRLPGPAETAATRALVLEPFVQDR